MNDYEMQNLAVLNRIALALEAIALTNAPAPNFVKPIEAYADFDFTSIGAVVKARDANGPTELEWGGYIWTRRSPQNKFGEAIWYSRPTGKTPEGTVNYSRLITFKKLAEAEPLPRKVEALVAHPAASGVEPGQRTTTTAARAEPSELDAYFGPNPRKTQPDDDLDGHAITWQAAFESLSLKPHQARAYLNTTKGDYEAAYKLASQKHA